LTERSDEFEDVVPELVAPELVRGQRTRAERCPRTRVNSSTLTSSKTTSSSGRVTGCEEGRKRSSPRPSFPSPFVLFVPARASESKESEGESRIGMRAGVGRRRFIPAAPTRPAGGRSVSARPDIRIFPSGISARAGYFRPGRPAHAASAGTGAGRRDSDRRGGRRRC
jgi:hypothetical protein